MLTKEGVQYHSNVGEHYFPQDRTLANATAHDDYIGLLGMRTIMVKFIGQKIIGCKVYGVLMS